MGFKNLIKKISDNAEKIKKQVDDMKNSCVPDNSGTIIYSDEMQIFSFKNNPGIPEDFYHYSDVQEAELQENGKTTHSINIARGVGLGLITGGVGAVVGLATGGKKKQKVELTIVVKFRNQPSKKIKFYEGKIKGTDAVYKESIVPKAIALTDLINSFKEKAQQNGNEPSIQKFNSSGDPLDELKKLKELLDINAITQEEYDKKKKELLNL